MFKKKGSMKRLSTKVTMLQTNRLMEQEMKSMTQLLRATKVQGATEVRHRAGKRVQLTKDERYFRCK